MSADPDPDPVETEASAPTEHAGRVTVDVDGYAENFELLAVRVYYNLARIADEVEVHVSSGGSGLHLIGWFSREVPFPERIHLRRQLADDPKRVEIDVQRAMNGVYTDVLWSEKRDESGRRVKDRDFADVHDALAHIRLTNTDLGERVARLAEHGHRRAPALARRAHGGSR